MGLHEWLIRLWTDEADEAEALEEQQEVELAILRLEERLRLVEARVYAIKQLRDD